VTAPPPRRGFVIAAPASGSGKTTLTLALLRAFSRKMPVRAAKSGPDYIDPQFHEAACGMPSLNLDAWAMPPEQIRALATGQPGSDSLLIVEGAMGLFDGAPPEGDGSAADLADILGLPVLLVIDAGKMAQSVAALVAGFVNHRPSLSFCGIILNRVGSPRHEAMLRHALKRAGLPPVVGALPRQADLSHPSRHLGLVQAQERPDLELWLDRLGDLAQTHIDLAALCTAGSSASAHLRSSPCLAPYPAPPPPAGHIAIASDRAFAFCYPHLLSQWHGAGARLSFFSPLADEPVPHADLVYLPGGYPELHAGRISNNAQFMNSLRKAARTTDIYGECGGYMVLGDALTDASGVAHPMAGLLKLHTSFAQRKLHLGYRHLETTTGPFAGRWRGHEFHYATTLSAKGPPLFTARDAMHNRLPEMGLHVGRVCGSFAHLIAPAHDRSASEQTAPWVFDS
jgi:cobyrinic acid a,c-diamide synthase